MKWKLALALALGAVLGHAWTLMAQNPYAATLDRDPCSRASAQMAEQLKYSLLPIEGKLDRIDSDLEGLRHELKTK